MSAPTRNFPSAVRRVIDNREVRIVFQPVVDFKTRQIFAYEALARTSAPEFDGPMSLFAAAVAEGLSGELGRLLRQMALDTCQTHPLFLNIHPAELNERWIVQPDDPIFNHCYDVYLEITEAVPLSHFQLCQNMLDEVRGRGVHLVVDDLGAGYSNLKYIADLHPRVVKLDRGLIEGLVRGSRLWKLVSAIVQLCHELDAKVVAEGIETQAELDAVVATGARYGQGYFLARPGFPTPPLAMDQPLPRREKQTIAPWRPTPTPGSSQAMAPVREKATRAPTDPAENIPKKA